MYGERGTHLRDLADKLKVCPSLPWAGARLVPGSETARIQWDWQRCGDSDSAVVVTRLSPVLPARTRPTSVMSQRHRWAALGQPTAWLPGWLAQVHRCCHHVSGFRSTAGSTHRLAWQGVSEREGEGRGLGWTSCLVWAALAQCRVTSVTILNAVSPGQYSVTRSVSLDQCSVTTWMQSYYISAVSLHWCSVTTPVHCHYINAVSTHQCSVTISVQCLYTSAVSQSQCSVTIPVTVSQLNRCGKCQQEDLKYNGDTHV